MIALALLCAAALAGPGAKSAAALVPANAEAAVLLEGSRAADGLRAFFDGVTQRAPALAAGPRLSALVGPDLLDQPLTWGLAPSGARAIVLEGGSFGLSAPVRDAKAARSALHSWLAEAGPPHPAHARGLRSALAAGEGKRIRAGAVALVAGTTRLLTASGPHAIALVTTLAQVAGRATPAISTDRALSSVLARLTGPAALLVRGTDPLRAAVLSLEGSSRGLVARGLLLSPGQLLAGSAPGPAACAGASLLCLRAGLGPSGRDVLGLAARAYLGALLAPPSREGPERLAQAAAGAAERVVVRSDGADPRLPSDEREALWAVRLQAVTAPPGAQGAADAEGPRPLCVRADASAAWFGTPCPASAPADPNAPGATAALEAQLDLSAADAVLQKLTPLDALRGGLAAALYAVRLTVGGFLRGSGPVVATGQPHPAGAEVELRWPLR
ncbi:MAG TPA: hypothetical protein VKB92_11515 [Myxococcales bacterium]|nr:hypothetical protein [Myxococcales bacterium]